MNINSWPIKLLMFIIRPVQELTVGTLKLKQFDVIMTSKYKVKNFVRHSIDQKDQSMTD